MQKSFGIRPIPTHGSASREAPPTRQSTYPPGRVAPSQLNMGTPSTVISIQMCRNIWRMPAADQTKDGACKGISAHNYGTFFKQRINQKGWHTITTRLRWAVYAARGRHAGFITYDDEVSTYTRVWYSDCSGIWAECSCGRLMLTTTAKRRICSIRRTWPVCPRSTDTRPGKAGSATMSSSIC